MLEIVHVPWMQMEMDPVINESSTSGALNIDSNGTVDALTDELLITRYLYDTCGNTLIKDSVRVDFAQCSANEIKNHLDTTNKFGKL